MAGVHRNLARLYGPERTASLVDVEQVGIGAGEVRQFGDQLDVAVGRGAQENDASRFVRQPQVAIHVELQFDRSRLDRFERHPIGIPAQIRSPNGHRSRPGFQGRHSIAAQVEPRYRSAFRIAMPIDPVAEHLNAVSSSIIHPGLDRHHLPQRQCHFARGRQVQPQRGDNHVDRRRRG